MPEPGAAQKRYPIGYLLAKGAYEAYHGATVLGLTGLLFTFLSFLLLPLFVANPQWIWALSLSAVPLWAGLLCVTMAWARGEKSGFREFLRGMRQFAGRSLLLMTMYLTMGALVWIAWSFWRESGGVAGMTFAMVQLYAFLMFLCAQLYTLPLMVKENLPLMRAAALSARLFLANPLYSVGLVLQVGSLAVVLAVGTVALPLLFPGLAAVLLSNATLNLIGELPAQRS